MPTKFFTPTKLYFCENPQETHLLFEELLGERSGEYLHVIANKLMTGVQLARIANFTGTSLGKETLFTSSQYKIAKLLFEIQELGILAVKFGIKLDELMVDWELPDLISNYSKICTYGEGTSVATLPDHGLEPFPASKIVLHKVTNWPQDIFSMRELK